MPGVAYILTPQNAPKTYPFPEELFSRVRSWLSSLQRLRISRRMRLRRSTWSMSFFLLRRNLEQAMAPACAPDLSSKEILSRRL